MININNIQPSLDLNVKNQYPLYSLVEAYGNHKKTEKTHDKSHGKSHHKKHVKNIPVVIPYLMCLLFFVIIPGVILAVIFNTN
jgi:hypothetical protein